MHIERRKPVSVQVSSILSERIRLQEYEPGDRLPSENQLANELGVSRATIRSALGKLAAEGLVIRRQGDGTYVNAHLEAIPTRLGGMWNFIRLIENSGHEASIRLISQTTRHASEAEAKALSLEAEQEVLSLTRIFRADGQPAIVAYSAAPIALLVVPAEQCHGELPLSEFVRRYYRRDIAYTIYDVEAVMPSAAVGGLLSMEAGKPILGLTQVFYDTANLPIFYSYGFLRDEIIRLRLIQSWR